MLPAELRLKKQAEFGRVMASGSKTKFGPLLIFQLVVPSAPARFGVVISKKVSRLATKRNYLKRLLTDQLSALNKTKITGDIVIVVLSEPADPNAAFTKALNQWHKQL